MTRCRISVALCTYNGARFLKEQLESIAAQTRPPDELVVCDDRSTDDTVEMLEAFSSQAPCPMRLEVNEHRLGSTKNFEKAIAQCQGEIIFLADQDDTWKPRKLAVLERTLEDHPEAGYVFSDAELTDESSVLIGRTLWESIHFRDPVLSNFSESRQVAALLHRNVAAGATLAFRSNLKNILLPISRNFVHDYWISLLASAVASYGIPIREPLILYRQHNRQQIGVRRMRLLKKIRWARRMGPTEYSDRTQGYLDLKDRLVLAAREGRVYPANHLLLLDEKIKHYSHRAAVHSTRGTAKVSKVLSEVLSGRYARFSNSWKSVVEDLCL